MFSPVKIPSNVKTTDINVDAYTDTKLDAISA